MSQFPVKGKHFTRNFVWFESAREDHINNNCDIVIIHGNSKPVKKLGKHVCESELQKTGISDLTKPEEELFRLINSSTRGHINRCIRNQVAVFTYSRETDILPVLEGFAETYHGMFLEKGVPDRYLPLAELKAYAKAGALLVTTAEIEGLPVQYHAYVIDKTHSRLLFSCSHFRSADDELRRLTGWSNDYLHWMDMLHCKELGITEYDWGGISSFENPNGIDKYKMKFGIEFREYYNITCCCSFPSKAVSCVRKLLEKVSGKR